MTRYKGVDITPQTVHNLIRTIASRQCNTTDSDYKLRSILLSFRPDLSNSTLSTDRLLITALKDCNKKDVTYNYKYETTTTTNSSAADEQHVASPNITPDIFLKIWKLHNVDREEACVLAGVVRDMCNAVLKNFFPDFDPDHGHSAATLLKLCTEVRYAKHQTNTENQAMTREITELENELKDSRAEVSHIMASFAKYKSESEAKFNMMGEANNRSENQVARLEFQLVEKDEQLLSLQTNNENLQALLNDTLKKLDDTTAKHQKCCQRLDEFDKDRKDDYSKISYLESQLQQVAGNNDSRLVLLEKEYAEKERAIVQKYTLQAQENAAQLEIVELRALQQSTIIEEYVSRLTKLENQNKLLHAQLIDARQKIDELNSDGLVKQQLQSELVTLKKENKELKTIISSDADSNTDLLMQNTKIKRDYDHALRILDEQQTKYDQLKVQLDQTLRDHEESTDNADRTYNLQKGEINALRDKLERTITELSQVNDKLRVAHEQIQDKDKTIEYCNYEIQSLSQLHTRTDTQNVTKTTNDKPINNKPVSTSKVPVKRKLVQDNIKQKMAKKTLMWDVNKLYGVTTQEQLSTLIDQIKKKNEKNKDWMVYNKFLSCPNTSLEQLEENPEFESLDVSFKKLLLKQRELLVEPHGDEVSLFSSK